MSVKLVTRMVFKIHGMDCAEEVAILRRELEPLVSNPDSLQFDVLSGKLIVEDQDLSLEQVVHAVAKTGMTAEAWSANSNRGKSTKQWISYRTLLTVASGISPIVLNVER